MVLILHRLGNLEWRLTTNQTIFGKHWKRSCPGATHRNTNLNARNTGRASMLMEMGTSPWLKLIRESPMSFNFQFFLQLNPF